MYAVSKYNLAREIVAPDGMHSTAKHSASVLLQISGRTAKALCNAKPNVEEDFKWNANKTH